MNNISCVHLIERMNNFTKLSDEVWESGYWSIAEYKARKLIGGKIYFHKKQTAPSFYGGLILRCRIVESGEYKGRIIFVFQPGDEFRGVKTKKSGWSNEKKIIFNEPSSNSIKKAGTVNHNCEGSDLITASNALREFTAGSFKKTVKNLEEIFDDVNKESISKLLDEKNIKHELIKSAFIIKKASSQIDEIIHAIGILITLQNIAAPGEIIESLSLAAGNTGKGFDVETNYRIAEFTFINWKGGAEVIRQNKIFKDFYFLAEENTTKRRELYVIGTELPLKFFTSKRGIARIIAGNAKLGESFKQRYGDKYKYVCEYYNDKKNLVQIKDICESLPYLKEL